MHTNCCTCRGGWDMGGSLCQLTGFLLTTLGKQKRLTHTQINLLNTVNLTVSKD